MIMGKDKLERLMDKLKTGKSPKEEPTPEEEEDDSVLPVEDEELEDLEEEDEGNEDLEKEKAGLQKKIKELDENPKPKKTEKPKEPTDAEKQQMVDTEIMALQNNGIYRRELIFLKKENNELLKVIAQILLQLKDALTGEDDKGKK